MLIWHYLIPIPKNVRLISVGGWHGREFLYSQGCCQGYAERNEGHSGRVLWYIRMDENHESLCRSARYKPQGILSEGIADTCGDNVLA